LRGSLPASIDGVPLHPGERVIYKNYGASVKDLLVPTTRYADSFVATYDASGRPLSITEVNPYAPQQLGISYTDMVWQGDKLVAFTFKDMSVQSQKLTLPSATCQYRLVEDSSEPNGVKFEKGMRVIDYRMCKPVALADFPNRACAPKTYTFNGALPKVGQLESTKDAMLPPDPNEAEGHPLPLLPFGLGILLIVSLAGVFRFRKK
jgi:hypothetical protein